MPAAKSSRRTAGEGSGRTARMHIPEESDSGIVPMNHSNKDGTLLAESEEGRLLIKENALPSVSVQNVGREHGDKFRRCAAGLLQGLRLCVFSQVDHFILGHLENAVLHVRPISFPRCSNITRQF